MPDSRIDQVFRNVKHEFVYRQDTGADRWNAAFENHAMLAQYGHILGDCDDFALRCRELLNIVGIDNRLVICTIRGMEPPGNGHLICTVEGYALDNRQRSVVPIDILNYDFLIQSGFRDSDKWHRCEYART